MSESLEKHHEVSADKPKGTAVDPKRTQLLLREISQLFDTTDEAEPKAEPKAKSGASLDDLMNELDPNRTSKAPTAAGAAPVSATAPAAPDQVKPTEASAKTPTDATSSEQAKSTENAEEQKAEAVPTPEQLAAREKSRFSEEQLTENVGKELALSEKDPANLVNVLHFVQKQLECGYADGAENLVKVAEGAASLTKFEDYNRMHREIIRAATSNPSVDVNAVGMSITNGLIARFRALSVAKPGPPPKEGLYNVSDYQDIPSGRVPDADPQKEAALKEAEYRTQSEVIGATWNAAEEMIKAHMFPSVDALMASLKDALVIEKTRGRSGEMARDINVEAGVEQAVAGDLDGMRARVDALRKAGMDYAATSLLSKSAIAIVRSNPDEAISIVMQLPVYYRENGLRSLASECAAKDVETLLPLVRTVLSDNTTGRRDSALRALATTVGRVDPKAGPADTERAFAIADEIESTYIRNQALFDIGSNQTDATMIFNALEKMRGPYSDRSDNSMEALARIALERGKDTQDRQFIRKVEDFIDARKRADAREAERQAQAIRQVA